MKNIYLLIGITIALFVISMDFLFYTNVFIDLLIVLFYVVLVSRTVLTLDTTVKEVDGEYALVEKKTALFAPLIFVFFLSITLNFGYILDVNVGLIMTILVSAIIVLLYGYIYISMTRNRIIVSNLSIKVEYLNNKSYEMKWADIVKVDFDWIYNMLVCTDAEGNKIKLDISLLDFLLVITMMKERLLKEDYEVAFQKLTKYYTIFLVPSNNIHLK